MKLPLKKRIILEYDKVELKHPSLGQIAKKVGCHKTYVFKVVQEYKSQNLAFGLKK